MPSAGASACRSLDDKYYKTGTHGAFLVLTFVSYMRVLRSGNIDGKIGIDKPTWSNELVICGMKYRKGIVVSPEDSGRIAYVEFALPTKGRRLLGTAGWAEEAGVSHLGAMRFRILVDGHLLFGKQLSGREMQELDMDLGPGRVLRIETDDGFDGNETDHMAFGNLRVID